MPTKKLSRNEAALVRCFKMFTKEERERIRARLEAKDVLLTDGKNWAKDGVG